MAKIANNRHDQARAAYEAGRLREAMVIVRECIRADEHDGRAWELAGLIHFSGGNHAHAVSSLEQASVLVPLKPTGRVCLGHAYARTGRTELAKDLLQNLINDDSLSIGLMLQVATGLDWLGRPDLSMHACRQAIQRDDSAAQAYYDLGFYTGRCNYPFEMTEVLGKLAIELEPDEPRFRIGVAGLLYRQDRFDEAYELVQHFSNDAIASLTCRCCTERLVDLYERNHDYRRVILCQQRLLELEISGGSNCMQG